MTFLYTEQQKLVVSHLPCFVLEDSQYEECWASHACHQLQQFYLLVNIQRVNYPGAMLYNVFTYTDKINYGRAIFFLNIDFRKRLDEFLDKDARTSIMQFTLTLSEIQWKKQAFVKVVTCWLRPTQHHRICTKQWATYFTTVIIASQKWRSVAKAVHDIMSLIMIVN